MDGISWALVVLIDGQYLPGCGIDRHFLLADLDDEDQRSTVLFQLHGSQVARRFTLRRGDRLLKGDRGLGEQVLPLDQRAGSTFCFILTVGLSILDGFDADHGAGCGVNKDLLTANGDFEDERAVPLLELNGAQVARGLALRGRDRSIDRDLRLRQQVLTLGQGARRSVRGFLALAILILLVRSIFIGILGTLLGVSVFGVSLGGVIGSVLILNVIANRLRGFITLDSSCSSRHRGSEAPGVAPGGTWAAASEADGAPTGAAATSTANTPPPSNPKPIKSAASLFRVEPMCVSLCEIDLPASR